MSRDTGMNVKYLRVDGGAAENNLLLQFQSDILNAHVERASSVEATSLGAAFLAGLAVGFWKDEKELASLDVLEMVFRPKMTEEERKKLYGQWKKAVEAAGMYKIKI